MSAADAAWSIPWDRLRAWIDQQEYVEGLTQQETPPGTQRVSRAQLLALSHLIDLVPAEPEMDGTDYVSLLLCLTQGRRLSAPTFHDLDAVELPTAGVFFPGWRTVCLLPSAAEKFPGGFPAVGFGLTGQDKGLPLFRSKKASKQYAAKHALAFLTSTPAAGPPAAASSSAPAPPPVSSSNSNSNSNSNSIQTPSAAQSFSASAAPTKPANIPERPIMTPQPKLNRDFSSDSGPSVFTRVAALATKLGLETPRFDTVEEKQLGVFTGFAEFRGYIAMPAEIGRVTGVLGKKNAKEQVAERVLGWLVEEDAARQRTAEEMEMAMARDLNR